MAIKHAFVSVKADGLDTTLVRPSDWNAAHVDENGDPIYVIVSKPLSGQYRILNIRLDAALKLVITYDDVPIP